MKRHTVATVLMILMAATAVLADPKEKSNNGHHQESVVTWPAPVVAGGAMPVTWTNIVGPSPTDHIGLYFPEGSAAEPVFWIYVSCSQVAHLALATGSCGFLVPSTTPEGTYEIRLYSGAGELLAKSPKFQIINGGF